MEIIKWPVLCLIVLGAVDIVKDVTALKKGDVGVCITKISSKINKRVTYTKLSNKWCGKRKCVMRVAKIQPIVETHEQPICCAGFTYQTETDDCAPLCTTGCHGGRCVAPDQCECDPPLYLDPEHQNTSIQPVCEPPCHDAYCTPNNTCQCQPQFETFNSTHCYKCDPGYSISSDLTCIPICEPACVNGDCTAPNVCSCFPGYIQNGSKCEPVCNCVNSNCVAPDTCSCLDGYSAVNSTYCAPACDHCNGNCVAPNKCECFEGYVDIEGSCRPVCESTCENGYCSGPNECTCNEGYVKNETNNKCIKPEPSQNEPGVGKCETKFE